MLNAHLGDHEPNELADYDIEGILARIQLHLMSMKGIENFLQVIDVVDFFEAFDEHIIDIDLYGLINLVFEDLVD